MKRGKNGLDLKSLKPLQKPEWHRVVHIAASWSFHYLQSIFEFNLMSWFEMKKQDNQKADLSILWDVRVHCKRHMLKLW